MRKRLATLVVATAIASGFGVATASATTTCVTKSAKVTSGSTTVTDTSRQCTLARGGWSRSVSHKVATKGSAGTVSDTTTRTESHTVTTKGVAHLTITVRVCHKAANLRETCTSTSTSN